MRIASRAATAALIVGCAVLARISPAAAQLNLFVTDSGSNTIAVFDRTASSGAPLRTLTGAATGLSNPLGIVTDTAHNELFVTNANDNSVRVYALNASDNTVPLRTLAGGNTLLEFPVGVLVDTANDELVVVNRSQVGTPTSSSVTVYVRNADGNTAPKRTITGPSTGLNLAHFAALDNANNEYFVSSSGGSTIRVFSRIATGDASPVRVISGASTGLDLPLGIAYDSVNAEIVVTNTLVAGQGGDSVVVYARNAANNASPLRTIAGNMTGLTRPAGVRVDPINNEIYVVNQDVAAVNIYARTADGNIPAIRTLGGGSTGLVPLVSDIDLGPALNCFDVDGNGSFDALTDGVILMRVMRGISGNAAIAGALGPNATRKDWNTIASFLSTQCGFAVGP